MLRWCPTAASRAPPARHANPYDDGVQPDLIYASWETIGWVAVDMAVCAFGDPDVLGEAFRLGGTPPPPSLGAVEDYTPLGVPLVALRTRDDVDIPVEVVRGPDDAVVAARLSAVDDLDELAGTWRQAGMLPLPGGRCVASDPYSPATADYRVSFDVAPGTWVAEVFEEEVIVGEGETLALRIRLA